MTMKKTVIIGAGLTGLACGYELARSGISFTIYEATRDIGGLSKTMWFTTPEGRFGFDFGGHRFLTRLEEIEDFFFSIVGRDNIETRQRSSRIYLKGKYYDYPIKPFSALLRMPIWITIKAGFTYWFAFFRYVLARRKGEDNFEDWVKHRFGSTLYGLFFRDYTYKTWGIDPKEISSVWASERIKATSFFAMVKNSLFRPDPESKIAMTLYKQFYYPVNGIQVLSDNLADYIKKNNQKIVTESKLKRVELSGKRISRVEFENGFKEDDFDILVSSIPLPNLIAAMGNSVPQEVQDAANQLKHRDLILAGFMLDKAEATRDSWIYFPEDKHVFVRISEPSKYGSGMCPPGKTSIAAEITCFEGDDKWIMPDDEIVALVKKQLMDLGFFTEKEIIDSFVVRTTHAYPIFNVGYEKNLQKVSSFLLQIENLELIGRAGTFQYLNMDMVLLHGLNCARKITDASDVLAVELGHDKKWVG
ncbi:MAG: FAD-dependent oxidoreductase [Candidatus Odinarchaeota archaeon]